MLELSGYLFCFSLFAFLAYQQIRLTYNRYLRSYETDIRNYLGSKGFKYIESFYPDDIHWAKSPFTRPPKFRIRFVLIHINGVSVTWTKKNYLIVSGQEKNKIQEFWLEITTTYFQKPSLDFREGKSKRLDKEHISMN